MKERSTLAKNNPFRISRFRYLELKNFCRQYNTWSQAKSALESRASKSKSIIERGEKNPDGVPIERIVEAIEEFQRLIDIVEQSLSKCNIELYKYLKESVIKGISYDTLNAVYGVLPCSRNRFYNERRKFFYILNRFRN